MCLRNMNYKSPTICISKDNPGSLTGRSTTKFYDVTRDKWSKWKTTNDSKWD